MIGSRNRARRFLVLIALCAALLHQPALALDIGETIRASGATPVAGGNLGSFGPSISATGEHVAFHSDASNLVPDDTNGQTDVFVRNLLGENVLLSIADDGTRGNGPSSQASISDNGRFVAFQSQASNLIPGDVNGTVQDVFLVDRDPDGNGSFEPGSTAIDLLSLSTSGVQGNGPSSNPSISGDGRFVAFESSASNLVLDPNPATVDIFIRDLQAGVTTLASVGHDGAAELDSEAPSLSSNGRFVTFASEAFNLVFGDINGSVDVFLRDRDADADDVFDEPGATTTSLVSVSDASTLGDDDAVRPALSSDGRTVVFETANRLGSSDTNNHLDIYVRDTCFLGDNPCTARTTRASTDSSGTAATELTLQPGDSSAAQISADGHVVVFASTSTALVAGDVNNASDVFVKDRHTGVTSLASVSTAGDQGSNASGHPSMSLNGAFVAFESTADNLVPDDTNGVSDVFLRDMATNTTVRLSATPDRPPSNGASEEPALSGDGRYLAFQSEADNLVPGDTDNSDIFVRDLKKKEPLTLISISTSGRRGNGSSTNPSISKDGRYVVFQSSANNLVDNDIEGVTDVFLHDRQLKRTRRISESSAGVGGNEVSFQPTISGDGSTIAFVSKASNLLFPVADTNSGTDIFVWRNGTISILIPGANGGLWDPSVSETGRYVAFSSAAPNLVPGNGAGFEHVFVRDRSLGTTSLVSTSTAGGFPNGPSGAPSISGNGLKIAFESVATNIVLDDSNGQSDIFLREVCTGCPTTTIRVSEPSPGATGQGESGPSKNAAISGDGTRVAFESLASNLVAGDRNECPPYDSCSDIFVRIVDTARALSQVEASLAGQTYRVSVTDLGLEANGASFTPSMSYDGTLTAFMSFGTNFLAGEEDDNGVADVFSRRQDNRLRVQSPAA